MLTPADWKLAGMRAVLGSEFLRNLGWSGFKPDRHVTRLFRRWFPDVVKASEPRAAQLAELIGRKSRDLPTYLTYSLVGIAVTPAGHALSEADNLVWVLGAYLERKGAESNRRYRVESDG